MSEVCLHLEAQILQLNLDSNCRTYKELAVVLTQVMITAAKACKILKVKVESERECSKS
jgi:hypothetical protein